MSQSIMERVAEAKRMVPSITPDELAAIIDRDDVLVVDVRDDNEVSAWGVIKGAVHVSRGMLEFRADDSTALHNRLFSRQKTIVLYCASGGRAALSGKALLDLGYSEVLNLGSFQDWVDNGGAVEKSTD